MSVADSGVQEGGRWVPAFAGQRPPFPRGNLLQMTHGAGVGLMHLAPRADEIANTIRAILPLYSEADEPVVRLLAISQARIERAVAALDKIDDQLGDDPLSAYLGPDAAVKTLQRLREDCRGWINTSKRLASELGMTPASRAKLGLDVALTRRALSLVELTAEAAEEEAIAAGKMR
jgi:hypothetical protein